MKELDIQEIRAAVRDQVVVTVNGGVDGIRKHLEEQDKILCDIKEEQRRVKEELAEVKKELAKVKPIVEAKDTIISIRKAVLWLAPAGAILWGWIKFLK
jgi:hypothetical protein